MNCYSREKRDELNLSEGWIWNNISAPGARLCPLLLPPGSHRPTENKRGDLIFHAGSSRIPCSTCRWGAAPPATECACLWNSGVPYWQQTSPWIKAMPSSPDLTRTMVRFSFPNCWLLWLLFHSVQNLVQGGEVPFIGPLQRLRHLVYSLETLRNNKKRNPMLGKKTVPEVLGLWAGEKGCFPRALPVFQFGGL